MLFCFGQSPRVTPKSALGKTITYCRNQWTRLMVFLEDELLELYNNRSEHVIKPFVIVRKTGFPVIDLSNEDSYNSDLKNIAFRILKKLL